MKRVIIGIVIGMLILFAFKFCSEDKKSNALIKEQSLLIQQQVKNVSKLVVTEGHFSEVFTYDDSKEFFSQYIKLDKKALVVVNAEVTVAYDLSKITYEIDEEQKILNITSIPKEEININPDIEYYDVQDGYLNPFEASDYNAIKNQVKSSLRKKFEASDLKENSKNRLISELAKFYIVTNSMGWTLHFKENPVENMADIEGVDFLD